ncbi:MAG: O-antigen ligase family protein [Desulfatibacillum sp.]|nr:O-antigen ligase family protein [Desulfatibacillum sp.]
MSGITHASDPSETVRGVSAIGRFCAGAIEACLIVMAVAVPLHFNVLSQHIFENHKYAMFRAGAFVLAGLWVVYMVDRGKTRDFRLFPKRGIMRPVLLYLMALVLSCLFSIGPSLSFWGEIFRHEGLISQLSTLGVFLLVLTFFRTPVQVERIVTILIFVSLPISLYAIAQHYGPDPMPWKGNVGKRCVSTLGNAVFLGALEVMIFFPTFTRIFSSLREDSKGNAGLCKASIYSFIAFLQILATAHSKSRGPVLGLIAGVIFLGVIWARALKGPGIKTWSKDLLKLAACLLIGVGAGMSVALVMKLTADQNAVFSAKYLIWPFAAMVGGGGITVLFRNNKASLLGMLALGLFLAFGVGFASSGIDFVKLEHPRVAEEGNGAQEEQEGAVWKTVTRQGTMEVRVDVWEGYIDIFFSSDPILKIVSPADLEVAETPFGFIRPVVGFGQETVGTAFRQRYPKRLLKRLPPSETADRAHNDFMSRLAATGVFGLAAYLCLLGFIFIHGLSAVGYSMEKRQRRRFALFYVTGISMGTLFFLFFGFDLLVLVGKIIGIKSSQLAPLQSETGYACLGSHAGLLAGVFAYCLFTKARKPGLDMKNPTAWTAIGLFCALVSHITEISVSFPFSSTALLFWIFSGLLVAIALRRLSTRKPELRLQTRCSEENGRANKNQVGQDLAPSLPMPRNMLVLVILSGVIISLVAFSFLGHQWSVVQQTRQGPVLTMPEFDAVPGMGLLRTANTKPVEYNAQKNMVFGGLLFLPCVIFCVMIFCGSPENPERLKWGNWPPLLIGAMGLVVISAFAVIIIHASSLLGPANAIPLWEDPGWVLKKIMDQSYDVASRIWMQYLWMFAIVLVLGGLLMEKRDKSTPPTLLPLKTMGAAVFALILVWIGVWQITVRPVIADVFSARAKQWGTGKASPRLDTQMDSGQFLSLIGLAHSLDAVKEAPFLTAFHTDLASDASVVAQKLPKKESFFKNQGSTPDFASLTIEDLPHLSQEDARNLGQWALMNCFAINPSDPQNAMNLARLYAQWSATGSGQAPLQDKMELAEKWYEIARRMTPHNAHFETEIGQFYYLTERNPAKAEQYLERSLELDDRKINTYLVMADVQMQLLAATCGPALKSAMTLHQGRDIPPSPKCQEGLDRVAELMEKALQVRPNNAESIVKLAGVFINARKPHKAIEALEKGFAVEPRNQGFMRQLVFICQKENNNDLGRDLFDRLAKKYPERAEILLASAAFYLQSGQRQEVLPILEKALALGSHRAPVWREAAKLWGIMGDFEKAAQCIEKALQMQARNSQNWMVAAGVYEQLKNFKKAAYALERGAHLTQNKQYAATLFQRSAQLWSQAGNSKRSREVERIAQNLEKQLNDS